MNPLTPLTFAACAVLITLIADSVWVSGGMLALAGLIALIRRSARAALLVALGIGAPAFVGFMLMYAPFGAAPGWWIFTADGSRIAASLGLRFLAATAIGLTLGSAITVDRLMRTLQTRLPARLVYVLGSTFRLFPMARARAQTITQIRRTRGMPTTGVRGASGLVLPLIVGLVDDASQRARPLQRTGFGEPGPRTILRPVPDSLMQRVLRWATIAATVGTAAWLLAGT